MNRRRLAGVLVAGLMAILPGMTMAGPAQAAGSGKPAAGTVKPLGIGAAVVIQNRGTGKCLDVARQSLLRGAQVWQWACDSGDPNQNWLIVPVASAPGWVSLRNLRSNLCLDLRIGTGDPVTNGIATQQWDCFPDSISSERWRLDVSPVVAGYLNIPSQVQDGMCLDLNGGSRANGEKIQVWDCLGATNNQLWRLG